MNHPDAQNLRTVWPYQVNHLSPQARDLVCWFPGAPTGGRKWHDVIGGRTITLGADVFASRDAELAHEHRKFLGSDNQGAFDSAFPQNDDLTVCAWLYMDSVASGQSIIGGYSGAPAGIELRYDSANGFLFGAYSNGNYYQAYRFDAANTAADHGDAERIAAHASLLRSVAKVLAGLGLIALAFRDLGRTLRGIGRLALSRLDALAARVSHFGHLSESSVG